MLKKQLKPLFFGVEKVDAQEYFSTKAKFSPSLTHLIVAETPTGPLIVNSCSKNYGLISNEDLMMPLIERLEDKYSVTAKVSQWGFSKFYTDFIIKDIEMKVQPKDAIFPRVRMNNSYDGSVKYQFGFGFYRQICENGMMAPVAGMQSKLIKLRHTPTNSSSAIDKTMAAIDTFLEEAPKIVKGYDPLIKNKIKENELSELIEEIIENTKYPKKREEAIIARIQEEQRTLGIPLNDFLIYNAFNYVLYNDPSKQKMHKRDKVDAQVLSYITNR